MRLFLTGLGCLVALAGAIGLLRPQSLLTTLNGVKTSKRAIYALSAVRVGVGLLMVLGAPVTAAPGAIRALGILVIVAGASVVVMGIARTRRVIDWFATRSTAVQRAFLTGGIAFGVFLAWAAYTG